MYEIKTETDFLLVGRTLALLNFNIYSWHCCTLYKLNANSYFRERPNLITKSFLWVIKPSSYEEKKNPFLSQSDQKG